MKSIYFRSLEQLQSGQLVALKDIIDELNFTQNNLIPVIAQDVISKEVLMLAWMNVEALQKTLTSGRMTYWSRSRKQLWVKGETSGHFQTLVSMRLDCDGDAILCEVEQSGAACHTGRKNCFYFVVNRENQSVSVLSSPA